MFNLQLSVSSVAPADKAAAMKITQFTVQDIPVSEDTLKALFTTRLYSTNQWKNGKCSNKTFERMSGVAVDVDQGITIAEAIERFKEFNFIIHTSTSHRANIPTKGGVQDRFRVILPFAPGNYEMFDSEELAKAAYAHVIASYSFVDTACSDPGRKYFPYLNNTFPENFVMHINDTGKYYEIDLDAAIDSLKAASAASGTVPETNDVFIHLEDEVVLPDKITKRKVKDFKKKSAKNPNSCYCNFCDDINSQSASAFIDVHKDGRHYMHCSHCQRTYWLSLAEAYPHIFYIDNILHRVLEHGSTISVVKMATAHLNKLPKDVRDSFEHELTNTRNFASGVFTVSNMVDPYATETRYAMNTHEAAVDVWTPPCPAEVADNAYVNNWLQSMFGEHTEFIKKWMAIWAYDNYKPLPMLVINGDRGVGKSSFGHFLQNMYPSLVMDWRGEHKEFTDYLEKKLLIIEEVPADKRDQYVEIKRVSGSEVLTVNKKHAAPYRVKNNLNIILLTNSSNPLYLHENERPVSPATNQFFMYTVTRDVNVVNAHLGAELKARAGHYIRTELKAIYEKWRESGEGKRNRYSIACPITDFEAQQFNDARSTIDYECDDILKACVTGLSVFNRDGSLSHVLGPYTVISSKELRLVMSALSLETKNLRTVRERLQNLNFFSKGNKIKKGGYDAWKVIGTLPADTEFPELDEDGALPANLNEKEV